MHYEEALKAWATQRMLACRPDLAGKIDLSTITADVEIEPGYNCCGGSDPNCYCSFATSPSLEVTVGARRLTGRGYEAVVIGSDFDFTSFLREVLEVGEGKLSL